MSLLVTCEILGLFFNTLTVNDRYSFRNSRNLPQPIQIQLSKKQKVFSQFFLNLYQILNILKPFESQHAKASQTLPKSA